jgi:hypothetical protein
VEADKARELHDELLTSKPEGARHDSDICPFCVDSSAQTTTSGNPPASSRSDESINHTPNDGGRDDKSMSDETITKATHEALLDKAVRDATSATEGALATKTTELAAAITKVTELEKANETLTADNARLNTELDTAQVSLKTATDEVAQLKTDAAAKDEAAAKAGKQSERADQVKGLGLFTEEYVTEKAALWATLPDDDWAARIDEWTKLKPASTTGNGKGDGTGDTASAMTGTTGGLTTDTAGEKKTPARRAALGLT